MPAVTQTTPNFLGGVSRQTDDKKLINQVTDCINGYPDPTFGLLKRPGLRHTNILKKADGTAFTKTELAGASWFYIDRSTAGSYVGCIKGADMFIWTVEDGTFCTVTNNGAGYLTGTNVDDYHFRSIQDTTIITNKTVTVTKQSNGSFVAKSQGTVKLRTLSDGDTFKVNLTGVSGGTTHTASSTSATDTFDSFLTGTASTKLLGSIKTLIEARHSAGDAEFSGRWYLNSFADSITIRRTTEANGVILQGSPGSGLTYKYFELSGTGGLGNVAVQTYQDEVTDITKLTQGSFHSDHVKILNSDTPEDDYYVEFVAENGTGGAGYWKETRARDTSPGLTNATMPHELSNTGATTFTFGPIDYEEREVGDATTNPDPSFVGKKITCSFFYSDRFGVLSEDNVIFGVANEQKNFFAKSALAQVDSDPIDLSVSSVRPVQLSEVLPSPQGLMLFSERQQFQVYATDASILKPSSAVIRALSNYEMATNVPPVDVGTTTAFVSRVPGYSKLFTMSLRDVEQTPIVVDISKAVLEWIPDTVDDLTVSPPNSVVMLVDRDTPNLYLYRYYNNGKEDLFQAWTRWKLPSDIQAARILDDEAIIVGQHGDEYTLGSIALDELPSGKALATAASYTGNVALDMTTRPVSPAGGVNAVVYDSTNDITKLYVPFTPMANKDAVMLLIVPTADNGTDAQIDSDEGYYTKAVERTEMGTGFRYFEVNGDFSSYADGIVVGYGYDLEVTLPKFYFRRDADVDYTATLTVSKVKLAVGRTGAIRFQLKTKGSNEWKDIQHTADAGEYQADTNPVVTENIFTLPIHQRNINFELKVTSDFPYPVSLVSMAWEGNYSPRFYRRA